MPSPTPGHIVTYIEPRIDETGEVIPATGGMTYEHPAIITRVWNDNEVNLTVFYDNSEPLPVWQVMAAPADRDALVGVAHSGVWAWPVGPSLDDRTPLPKEPEGDAAEPDQHHDDAASV